MVLTIMKKHDTITYTLENLGEFMETATDSTALETVTEKDLTPRQEKFLDVLFNEARGNFREAMRLAGYSPNTHSTEVVKYLKDEIVERAKTFMALTSGEAFFGIYDVLQNPKQPGGQVKINAAKEILDRAGIIKKEEHQAPQAVQNIFILPEKKPVEVIDGDYRVID